MITCTFEDGHAARLRHVVVHAIVERVGALLLVRRAPHLSEGGRWGLPGGFLDRDERLVDGVLRELREETGWTGEVRRLFRINSRPDRPREDRQNVAVEFVIERVPALDSLAFDHGETVRLYLAARDRPDRAPILE